MLILQLSHPTNAIFSYIGAGITIGEIIFLVIQLSFGFEQQMILSKNSALKYMQLRDRYRALIVDIMGEKISSDEITSRRNLLQSEYQVISDLSPQTGIKEYEEAQRRLNKKGVVDNEQFTWSDEEIDRFLPENLRIAK
jgi:predicted nucleic acid-binding protein